MGALTGAIYVANPMSVDIADNMPRLLGKVNVGVADSIRGSGRVVAPGAGVQVAAAGALVTGTVYYVWVTVSVGAGGLAVDAGNMVLFEAGALLMTLAHNAPGEQSFGPFRRTAGAAAPNLIVSANAAATAGVPYTATIIAQRAE